MDHWMAIELVHGRHDPILEFLFGCDADVAQHRAGEFGEEAFDQIEPGAVGGREGEFEAAGRLMGEPSLGFLGNMRGMIVEDQLDRCVRRILVTMLVTTQVIVTMTHGKSPFRGSALDSLGWNRARRLRELR